VFSRTGRRTHFRICVATRDEAQVELERIKREEGANQDEYWLAELEADAETWARSMNIYKPNSGEAR
jgi:hypothetical protein